MVSHRFHRIVFIFCTVGGVALYMKIGLSPPVAIFLPFLFLLCSVLPVYPQSSKDTMAKHSTIIRKKRQQPTNKKTKKERYKSVLLEQYYYHPGSKTCETTPEPWVFSFISSILEKVRGIKNMATTIHNSQIRFFKKIPPFYLT